MEYRVVVLSSCFVALNANRGFLTRLLMRGVYFYLFCIYNPECQFQEVSAFIFEMCILLGRVILMKGANKSFLFLGVGN